MPSHLLHSGTFIVSEDARLTEGAWYAFVTMVRCGCLQVCHGGP